MYIMFTFTIFKVNHIEFPKIPFKASNYKFLYGYTSCLYEIEKYYFKLNTSAKKKKLIKINFYNIIIIIII